MMGPITFDIVLFKNDRDIARSRQNLLWLMEALVQVNMGWIKNYPTSALYKSGVVYVPEVKTEVWQDIPTIVKNRSGDCEDLACWRVAELRTAGINARPYIKWRRNSEGGYTYHALVWLPGGKIEDPSIALGMHGTVTGKPVYVDA